MPTGEDHIVDDDGGETTASDVREAFALLGHEIRLDILMALLEHWRAAHTEPRSYSDLMRAVGIEDSGKFNYHLGKLRGVYVKKVEGGYVPTGAATALYRAVLATDPTGDAERTDLAVDANCPDCGGVLRGVYEQDFLSVSCQDCGSLAGDFTYPFPKNGLNGRRDQEVLAAVQERAEHHISLARSGQCPFCTGTTAVTVLVEDLGDPTTHDVEITCSTCTFVVRVKLLFALVRVPRVTAALLALGIEVGAVTNWELPEPTIQISNRDPLVIASDLETEQGTARIVVDDDLDVQSVTVDGDSIGTI
jgi:DNA-binding transcriptional ArsR family regulator